MKKIVVVIGSRANYSSIKSVLKGLKLSRSLELYIICNTSSISEKYGDVSELIKSDGFDIYEKHFNLIEGKDIGSMARTTGFALLYLSNTFENLKPDFVLTVGDRYETIATALAASYMNIPLIHTMGGEVSGTIDESIRHAISKLSNIHFPASEDAKNRLIKMGEDPSYIFNVGCPRIDLVDEILQSSLLTKDEIDFLQTNGVGAHLTFDNPFILVSQHPVTTEFDKQKKNIRSTISALDSVNIPKLVLWPNSDAGTDAIAQEYRIWRENGPRTDVRFYKNLPINIYVKLMNITKCLVGNSSSGIREGAFIGTPVVNIGSRQHNRECGRNVIHVDYDSSEIINAISEQLKKGKYDSDSIYGSGNAGTRISEIISDLELDNVQKNIGY